MLKQYFKNFKFPVEVFKRWRFQKSKMDFIYIKHADMVYMFKLYHLWPTRQFKVKAIDLQINSAVFLALWQIFVQHFSKYLLVFVDSLNVKVRDLDVWFYFLRISTFLAINCAILGSV